MFGSKVAAGSIDGAYKFGIGLQLLQHPHVFTAYWTMRQGRAGPRCHSSSGADCDRAINNRQRRLEEIDVTSSFAYKILDLKWIADVQYVHFPHGVFRQHKVHSTGLVMLRKEFEQGSAHFSEAHHDNAIVLLHC